MMSGVKVPCPECGRGWIRQVSRVELVRLSGLAGVELVPWVRSPREEFWWCDRCATGGALLRG